MMSPHRCSLAVLLACLLCVVPGAIAFGQALSSARSLPAYAPDHVIVKLAPQAALAALGRGGRTLPAGLARTWSRAQVRGARPVFEDLWPAGAAGPVRAADRAQAVRARFPQRTARAVRDVPDPDLENIVVLQLAPGASVSRALAALQQDANVVYAEPDRIATASAVPNDPYYTSSGSWRQPYRDMWGLYAINAASAWSVTTGADNVVIGVVDTGIDSTHPDLAGKIWTNSDEIPGNGLDDDGNGFVDDVHGWDFVNNDNSPVDGHGHGTHVSGTIAAATNNSTGIAGLNWRGAIMPAKGLDDTGSGSTIGLARAMRYCAENGADVMNNSWGGFGTEQFLQDVVNHCYALGCIVVAAAGNEGADAQFYEPAGLGNVVTVAASAYGDLLAGFSNYGTAVDVSAPGVDILSLRAVGTDMYGDGQHIVGTYYYRSDGTSMACPHAAGSLALLTAAHPTWNTAQLVEQLVGTADNIDAADAYNLSYEGQIGLGRINLGRALTGAVQGKRLAMVHYAIDDAAGDADGQPDAGERINVFLTLKHFTGTSDNVTATLSCADPRITIVTPTVSLGTVTGWRTITNAGNPLVFDVGATYAATAPLVLKVTLAATGYQSEDEIRLFFPAGSAYSYAYLPTDLTWGEAQVGDVIVLNLDNGTWQPASGFVLRPRDNPSRWGTPSVPLSAPLDPLFWDYTAYADLVVPLVAPPVSTLRYPWNASATTPARADGLRADWDFCLGQTPLDGGHAWQSVVISRFNDIAPGTAGGWARTAIEEGAGRVPAIIAGFSDGTYRPTKVVDRGTMAVYMARALKLPLLPYEGTFPDVPSTLSSATSIEALARAGIVKGYSTGDYQPATLVNRASMATYVARGLAGGDTLVPPGPATPTFSDVPTTNGAYKYIEYAVSQGVVTGYSDGTYRPDKTVTRDQMAVYLYRGFVQPVPHPVVLAGPAATAADPATGGDVGWLSQTSGPVSNPGFAYVAFDAMRFGPALAFGGTWDVTFELRQASTPGTPATGAYTVTRSFTTTDLSAAQAAAQASGYPYFLVAWDIPAGLTAGDYVLVVSAEDSAGVMWPVARQPAFTLSP